MNNLGEMIQILSGSGSGILLHTTHLQMGAASMAHTVCVFAVWHGIVLNPYVPLSHVLKNAYTHYNPGKYSKPHNRKEFG